MWVKIAVGLAVLAGSWIALYALRPDSWKFVGLYLLNAVAQTFLLLNIAHDSNHNAISSMRSVNKALNYVFDVCGINSYMWRILHHRGHHSCINLHGEDDALTGRGVLRFTPYEPRTRLQRFQHVYALLMYALFSLDYVFLRDFECFFFPSHDYLKRTKHPAAGIRHSLCRKGFLRHLHADLARRVVGEIAPAGRFGFRAFSFDYRFERSARIPDDARDRQHLLPSRPQRVRQLDPAHLRDHGRLRDRDPAGRLARRRAESSYRPSSVPFCLPHSLCSTDPDREADRRGVWRSLSATSHDDGGRSNIICYF